MSENSIGFYAMLETQDKQGYIGAILVTDDVGKPLEFRVTYPVKPNVLQRTLYGDSLPRHLGVELCGQPLLRALDHMPKVLIVSAVACLDIAKNKQCLVAYLERIGATIKIAPSNIPSDKVDSPSGRFDPISVTYPLEYTPQEREETRRTLEHFFTAIDLTEPFSRIAIALKALAEQDAKFR